MTERNMPMAKHTTPIIADAITTDRNFFQIRIAESAGNSVRLVIKSAPIMRIPRTTVTAVKIASRLL